MAKLADIYRTPKGRKVIAATLLGGAAVATGGMTAAPGAIMGLLQALLPLLGG